MAAAGVKSRHNQPMEPGKPLGAHRLDQGKYRQNARDNIGTPTTENAPAGAAAQPTTSVDTEDTIRASQSHRGSKHDAAASVAPARTAEPGESSVPAPAEPHYCVNESQF